MADELVFYTHPMSRGRIIRWMLEEMGAPYSTELVGYGTTMKTPEYLAINPMGKVPAIRHNGVVVTEAAAICAYLADAFPEAGLAPPPNDRGLYYRWLFFAAGPVEAATTNRAMGFAPNAEQEGMVGYGNFENTQNTLEAAVSANPYITGEKFTAADIYVGAHVSWGMDFGTLDKKQAFIDYWGRLSERPAHVRAVEIDDKLVAELEAQNQEQS